MLERVFDKLTSLQKRKHEQGNHSWREARGKHLEIYGSFLGTFIPWIFSLNL
jgi:hypothetical protein